jgi:hypothetical protein
VIEPIFVKIVSKYTVSLENSSEPELAENSKLYLGKFKDYFYYK